MTRGSAWTVLPRNDETADSASCEALPPCMSTTGWPALLDVRVVARLTIEFCAEML